MSGMVALTWGMGGACFFLANLAVGRLLPATFAAMLVITPLDLIVPSLPLAMVIAALTAGTHGAAIGTMVSVMVGRYTALRGAVLGLNAAGANLGTFAGAAIGGVVLGVAGYLGLAFALAALVAATLAVTVWALRGTGTANASGIHGSL
jgi:predicted MFS family arabinose efflux permease